MLPSFVPKVDYGIVNTRCSHPGSASGPKAIRRQKLQTLLAAAAEKRMLFQAMADAAAMRQQALFEQYKNNQLILSLISLEKNSQEKCRQGAEHDSSSSSKVNEEGMSESDDDSSRASSQKDDSSTSFGDELASPHTRTSHNTEEIITEHSHCCDESLPMSERDNSSLSEDRADTTLECSSKVSDDQLSDNSSVVSITSSQKTDNLTISLTPEQEKKWKCRFNEFLEFVRENGHGAVPQVYPKNQQLSRWVRRQRQQYRFYKDGKKSAMTAERLESLTSAGFIWHGHEVIWVERINALKRYRKRYGDCNVTISFDKKLGAWVKHQRRHYKLYKEGRPSSINAQRIEELDRMGFDWQPSKKVL